MRLPHSFGGGAAVANAGKAMGEAMAICPVCGGRGLHAIPHVPSISGGWLDRKFDWPDFVCGACNGSGYIDDEGEPSIEPDLEMEDEEEDETQDFVEQLIQSVEKSIRCDRIDEAKETLQEAFQFGRYRRSFPPGRSGLLAHIRSMDEKKLDLLDSVQLSDEISNRRRAVLAVLIAELDPTSIVGYQKVKSYFDRIKPATGGTLLELGLEILRDQIWEWEKQSSLGMW
jgi:hypothetical protein